MLYDVPASMKPAPLSSRPTRLLFGASDSPLMRAAIYRWEFLRRSLEYRADYARFIGSFGDWLKCKGNWSDSETRANWTKSDQKYFRAEIEPVLTELCQKWEVCDLFPPELGEEEWAQAYESGEDARSFPPTLVSSDGDWDSRSIKHLKRWGFDGTCQSTRLYRNLLLIQVNLNSPMKDLLDHVSTALRSAKETHQKEMSKRGLKSQQR